jgi:hypothetical protein
MSMLGLMLLASGCATMVIAPEPYSCPPLTDKVLDEYTLLVLNPETNSLRAWIREADKACRANEQLLKEVQ